MPMSFIAPVDGIPKCWYQLVAAAYDAASTMIEVEVSEYHIGYIVTMESVPTWMAISGQARVGPAPAMTAFTFSRLMDNG